MRTRETFRTPHSAFYTPQHYLAVTLAALALLYAALAGLHTVGDFDLGWQLATGRYVVQEHRIPSTDVFSYTARGAEWIYPPFSGVLFYLAWLLGGYAALSWIGAAACAGTVGLIVWAGWSNNNCGLRIAECGFRAASFSESAIRNPQSAICSLLAIVAVPLIAFRTLPRAELFTTLFFAAFLAILWRYRQTGDRRPEAGGLAGSGLQPPAYSLQPAFLPFLMLAWVNLHLGFIAGLALVAAYLVAEVLELPFAARRAGALLRLRRAAPWLAATVVATLANPWGPRIYTAIARQNRILKGLGEFVGEWSSPRISPAAMREALAWRSPDSAFWWLLAITFVALGMALYRRQFGAALLLSAAAVFALRYVRAQGLFAVVTAIVAGTTFGEFLQSRPALRDKRAVAPGEIRIWVALAVVLAAAMIWLGGARVSDLVSNSYYLSAGETSLFGPGVSWWYPERAAAFLLRERLPGNIFHDYNLGGYLTWRLGPRYPDYLDGRAVPFGERLFFHHRRMQQQPPDSLDWQREADQRGINTLIFSVARYAGLGSTPLRQFCQSRAWQPVYLDEVAAIFVRNRPENAPWINRLKIDCASVPFRPPASLAGGSSPGRAAELYNFYANAGSVLYLLERDEESWQALERARNIYPDDSNLHLTIGQLFQANNRIADAVREYETAVRLKRSDINYYALGRAYAAQGRYGEAASAIRRSASLSIHAYDRYRSLGYVHLSMNQPQDALRAFDDAARLSPYKDEAAGQGTELQTQIAAGRARAWQLLGDLARAVEFQKKAIAYSPDSATRWLELAELYRAQGQAGNAEEARRRAQELQSKVPAAAGPKSKVDMVF